VPAADWLDNECIRYFGIPRGLSLLEADITIAAHKIENPNGTQKNIVFFSKNK
jgi:hypothetical protein